MIQERYLPITLPEAIASYQSGLISAASLLYHFLKLRLDNGLKITLHEREITKELKISAQEFYQGIQWLKEKNLINWEVPNGIVVNLTQPSTIREDFSQKTQWLEEKNLFNVPYQSVDQKNSLEEEILMSELEDIITIDTTATVVEESKSNHASVGSSSYQLFMDSLGNTELEIF